MKTFTLIFKLWPITFLELLSMYINISLHGHYLKADTDDYMADPDFTLSFEERDEYLYAFVNGIRDSVDVSKGFWKQIHLKAKESGFHRILVEEDFPNQITIVEMFEVAEYIAELYHNMKIAHVDKRLTDFDLNRFGETVSTNRGLQGKVFNQVAEAEQWLIH